ncbi:MFS transporter [Mycolicibacterium tusciae]|uniref:MFS transporter n=1 Tax=Mycolicibacterium tusciae TaxID=75922 RepID=UPI00024A439D|nr:MFS transporter [Mycolicibacterium tusciae]
MSSDAEGDCSTDSSGQVGKPKLPREVWLLVAANVVVALGYGVVSPVLPEYARHFGVSISAATFVITAFALMRLAAAPPAGWLVQRLGERRVYINGLLIVAVSTAVCAFAQTYWQLLLFRSLGGLGSAMFSVSSLALMIRISPQDARGRVAGLFSSGFLIGSVGGPVLGSLTAGLGLAAPFAIYGAALLVAAAVVFFSLRCSTVAAPEESAEPPVSLREVLRHRAYRAALLSNFATGWAAFGLRIALVPLFIVDVLGRSTGVAGLALATFAIGNVSVVIPSGYLSDRIGRRKLLIVGLMAAAMSTSLLGVTSSLVIFLVIAYVSGAATGIFISPQQAAVADIVGNQARGGAPVAVFQMMVDVGSIGGSLLVGMIAQHASFGWAFFVSGAVLFVAAIGWVFAPETYDQPPAGHTPARPLGPEAAGEVP